MHLYIICAHLQLCPSHSVAFQGILLSHADLSCISPEPIVPHLSIPGGLQGVRRALPSGQGHVFQRTQQEQLLLLLCRDCCGWRAPCHRQSGPSQLLRFRFCVAFLLCKRVFFFLGSWKSCPFLEPSFIWIQALPSFWLVLGRNRYINWQNVVCQTPRGNHITVYKISYCTLEITKNVILNNWLVNQFFARKDLFIFRNFVVLNEIWLGGPPLYPEDQPSWLEMTSHSRQLYCCTPNGRVRW